MKDRLVYAYSETDFKIKEPVIETNEINLKFEPNPIIEILVLNNKEYDITFYNQDTGSVIYRNTITNNCWAGSNIKYFVNWKIEVAEKRLAQLYLSI